uniref:Protein kinase domain-containing protein n=1 Tax=Kalanchoe fedtschenkoi TaxID=63787 RepID=A0A7N0U156_KALFE
MPSGSTRIRVLRLRHLAFSSSSSSFFFSISFVLVLALHSTAAAPASESDILLQFKSAITHDPFGTLTSWAPGRSTCRDFHGVYCNAAGSVDRIVLWNASLSGTLSPALSKLRSLRVLTLFGNSFTGNVPEAYAEILTLWKINVSSNSLSGNIPEFLGSLRNIRFLDLSRNSYSGEIPDKLFSSCDKAKFISLSHNALTGAIPESVANCSSLEGFDFAFNRLSGALPDGVCKISTLRYLSVRSNALSGRVDDRVSGCVSLELLDLGSNGFTGRAPFEALGFKNLSYFNVSYNRFDGEIGEAMAVMTSCSERLEFLDASGNGFTGEIPGSIARCESLKLLDLGFNRLSGNFPGWIGSLKRLSVIGLGSNSLTGRIPPEIGTIELLWVLDLHNLDLVGEIPASISHCRYLRSLNLSGNALAGEIPRTLDNMTSLEFLDLHRNELNGTIPATIGNLRELKVLDLAENHLSGEIPPSLGDLTKLTQFNASSNNLSGAIPSSPLLQGFGSTAFLDNPGLCGSPLATPCSASDSGVPHSERSTKKLTVSTILAIVAAAIIFTGVCIICVINIRARRSSQEDETTLMETSPVGSSDIIIGKLVLFSKALPSRYEDWEAGTKALLDKNCLVGSGSMGLVYKASLEGGVAVAVKKLQTLGRIRSQDEFEFEIGRLGNLRHPNLVPCQGYYWSSTTQLILSEFVPNGNLFDNLHGLNHTGSSKNGSDGLNWGRRFHIALGTARALAYLHHDCVPQILHLDVKASNVLLDANFSPKLSDYGLTKFLPVLDPHRSPAFQTGYTAPELIQAVSRSSDKSDVYSFGVILLELVTGRKPVESSEVTTVLCEYVRVVVETGVASGCFDRRLRGGLVETELIQVMKLGLICTSETPGRRPSMAEAVQVLESIRSEMESSS